MNYTGKLLVCGGRDFDDWDRVKAALDKIERRGHIIILIHGDCPTGADRLADEWAWREGIARLPFPVSREEWQQIGPRAGPLRNQRMLDIGAPDACVAFPGGRGTADMVRRCETAKVPVWRPFG